jgi:TonB-dependent starch-binding outer membrane protein SusC
MLNKILLGFIICLFSVSMAFSQGSVSGQVTEASSGETIPGANVLITELERGAATDLDGNFLIQDIPAGSYTISVTFVGYQPFTQSIEVRDGEVTEINPALREGAVGLSELVVTGYAVTTKREQTGSISSVRAAEIQDVTLQNPEMLLQGRAAGVNVTSTSGNPGAGFRVSVRGTNTINAASEPLYIVDGVQISFSGQSNQTDQSPLNSINPSDIESIEVLKDAASAAIYGAQAASGVVLITTKRGQQGRTQVTARAETGVRSLARNVDYINVEEYIDFLGEAMVHNGTSPNIEDGRNSAHSMLLDIFGSPNNDGTLANTNWQDFVFQDGVTQRYSISLSGGDASTSFYISGGIEDTEGTAFNSDFTRLNIRSNIDHQLSDRVRGSLNINLARNTQFGVCQDGNFINCPASQAMFEPPMSFPFLADGEYNPNTNFGLSANPAVVKNEVDRNVSVVSIISDVSMLYRAANWLTFNGMVGVDYRNTEDELFTTPTGAPATGGSLNYWNRNVRNFNTNLVANAIHSFGDVHNVSGLLGVEYRRDYSEFQFVQGQGFPGSFFNVLGAASSPTGAGGVNTEWRLGSYFGNLKYNYDERYYISLVSRYDGHSRFGNATRWGFFPSVSGAWRISEEDFFNVGFIDEFKLRAGYGTTGNANLGNPNDPNRNFIARGLYSASGSYQGVVGLAPGQLSNENLGWEEAREINVGVDFEFLEGRITTEIDLYRKDTHSLLFQRPLPTESGFSFINENIGKVRNKGIEFNINTVNVSTRDFVWSTRFNIAFMDNEIMELPDNNADINPNSNLQSLQVGQPVGLIQVPRWAGVNPADGRPMWYDADGNITYTPVQSRDAIEYKNGQSRATGGFGNTISYRGLTLDAFFNFNFGQWSFAQTDYFFTKTPDFLMNLVTDVNNRWRQPGDITHYPRAMEGGADFVETVNFRTTLGTNSIYNASYIRLKNITLSYSLPNNLTDRIGIGNVRLFATGLNLLTWTAWPWYDPEVAFSSTDTFLNNTAASYPTERQVNAGIEIQF